MSTPETTRCKYCGGVVIGSYPLCDAPVCLAQDDKDSAAAEEDEPFNEDEVDFTPGSAS